MEKQTPLSNFCQGTGLPLIIALSGKQFSGKDTVATLLIEQFPQYQRRPIAFAIKKLYAQQQHISLEELEAHKSLHREGLIALGQWGRAHSSTFWLEQLLAPYRTLPVSKTPIIVTDMRLKEEFNELQALNAFMIRVNADRATRLARAQKTSPSGTLVQEEDTTECDLDHICAWDKVIENNDSLESLRLKLQQLWAV